MKSPIDIETHGDIMRWGTAFYTKEAEAPGEILKLVQKLGDLGMTSRDIDDERLRRVNATLTPKHFPTPASIAINRAYLPIRDFVSLGEGQVDEAANGFNLFRFMDGMPEGISANASPQLALVEQPQQSAESTAAA